MPIVGVIYLATIGAGLRQIPLFVSERRKEK
jgi:hypothetical protein